MPSKCLFYSLLVAGTLLSACTLGPDFAKPEAPKVNSYTSGPLSIAGSPATLPGGGNQVLVSGQDIPGEWWKLFQSEPLNDLITRALNANPNLKAAQAALKVAQENTLAQYGTYYPSVSASITATRQKTSAVLQPTPNSGVLIYNLYTPQVNVSYTPDVFGLNTRTVETLKAQEEATRFALIATNITLSSNIVAAAIQEASLREQIAATRESIAINTDMLKILRNQFAKGSASRLDVAAQESQLAQISATLPPLQSQLAQQRDLIAVLAGGFPGDGVMESFTLADLKLPAKLPLTIPSRLIEQRPDVRQAEENMHAANAQIGVAVANQLPNLTITADVGSMALAAGKMFTGGTEVWMLTGDITQSLFQGGALMHKERAARAAYTQVQEQYRSAVLVAFQNVADTLNALQQAANTLKSTIASRDAAKATLDLTRRQLQSGSVNYLTVLNAEQAYQQAKIALIQAQANRLSDTAALFQALGGGWWNKIDAIAENTRN